MSDVQEANLPPNEALRLEALRGYEILDTPPEQDFDDLTEIASRVTGTPIALVSLVDENRQWFKSKVGLTACETSRSVAFCSHAILDPEEVFVVGDALLDPRFRDNPLVTGHPEVRFYAGAPLVVRDDLAVGTLCVIDHEPRVLEAGKLATLRALARQVVSQLELRRAFTRLHVLASELDHANQDLEAFSSIAAHDLQEPTRKLVSFSQLLQEDLGGDLPPRAADDLHYIVDAATRMQRLVSDLLEFSRTGRSEPELAVIDLQECLDTALENLSIRVQERGARVEAAHLPWVRANATLLVLLFQNLIGNALKFSHRDRRPHVEVTLQEVPGELVIGIRDNGIGIAPEHRERIFLPFQRLHRRDEYEGSGIGLSVCRRVIQRLGGRIWVESDLGRGTHIRFTLPRRGDDFQRRLPQVQGLALAEPT